MAGDRAHEPRQTISVSVDVENEQMTFRGTTYQPDRQLALILKCLLDAHGEIRSTTDIKNTYPNEPWEERLDLTINRKLLTHVSGIGDLIESVTKKGYRINLTKP